MRERVGPLSTAIETHSAVRASIPAISTVSATSRRFSSRFVRLCALVAVYVFVAHVLPVPESVTPLKSASLKA